MNEGSRTEGHLERIAASLERLVVAAEALAFPSRVISLGATEGSRVTYVDDAGQLELELRQQAYWANTGRKLEPWEAPPRPVDDDGREWKTPDSRDSDPTTGA